MYSNIFKNKQIGVENVIDKKELKLMLDRLDNGVDKFILAGLFYGLNDSDNREQLLNITKDMIDIEKSTITLQSGKVVVMDEILRSVAEEALNQKIYIKMGSHGRINEDYEFNPNSKYVIRVKPTTRNNNGVEPLTNAGFKSRIRSISEFLTGDVSALTPTEIKKAGAYSLIESQQKKMTIMEAESLLKANGLSIRRNNLIPMLKEINGGV